MRRSRQREQAAGHDHDHDHDHDDHDHDEPKVDEATDVVDGPDRSPATVERATTDADDRPADEAGEE